MTDTTPAPFSGAKILLFLGPKIVVIRRDNIPGIPWPGYLDFPGGGREGVESPEACALRETREEISITLAPSQLGPGFRRDGISGVSWFFAAHLSADRVADIKLGNEGTGWHLFDPRALCARDDMIPHFSEILRHYLTHGF